MWYIDGLVQDCGISSVWLSDHDFNNLTLPSPTTE